MKLMRGAVLFLVPMAFAIAAQAQSTITRAQVLSELAEARRMGETMASGCGGGTLREQFPHRYPSLSVAAIKQSAAPAQRSEGIAARGKENIEASLWR